LATAGSFAANRITIVSVTEVITGDNPMVHVEFNVATLTNASAVAIIDQLATSATGST
jgi:hypothetical protein